MGKSAKYGLAGLALGLVIGFVSMWYVGLFDTRDFFLTPRFYYEIPSGGYVYVEDEYIRYNEYEFNGILGFQITLNYEPVGPRR